MTVLINYNLKKKTGVVLYKNLKLIRKFARDARGVQLLKNDYKGFNWYIKNLRNFNQSLEKCRLTDTYLEYPFFEGKVIKYWDSLVENAKETKIILEFYKNSWPSNAKVPSHGDLTFSNIIFNKNKNPVFIDWENFSPKEPWGLDICYFLISTVALPCLVKNQKQISDQDLSLFEKIWKDFYGEKKFEYHNKPVEYLRQRFKKYFKFRNYNDYFPNKISSYIKNQIYEVIN